MAAGAIRVTGLRELERAFSRADRHLRDDMRDTLAEAAAPVRAEAQLLAGTTIRGLPFGAPWTRMRVGVQRSVAYIAPVERGVKGRQQARRRPNFGNLLMDRAMEPALERRRGEVERRFEGLVDEVADVWERT